MEQDNAEPTRPTLTLTTVNIGAPEPAELARFYAALLGWKISREEPDDVYLRHPDAAVSLSFQREPDHVPPVWPAATGDQQMMMHLEVRVDDLPAAVEHALACGARLATFQPQDEVRVCLDPVGHPFCLWLG